MYIMWIEKICHPILNPRAYIRLVKMYGSVFVIEIFRHSFVYNNTDHPRTQIGLWPLQEEAIVMNNAVI